MQILDSDIEVMHTTNDRDHSVFARHKPSFTYAVSETKLRGNKDDDAIRMRNRDNAIALLRSRLQSI
jgi:hypothetical protein